MTLKEWEQRVEIWMEWRQCTGPRFHAEFKEVEALERRQAGQRAAETYRRKKGEEQKPTKFERLWVDWRTPGNRLPLGFVGWVASALQGMPTVYEREGVKYDEWGFEVKDRKTKQKNVREKKPISNTELVLGPYRRIVRTQVVRALNNPKHGAFSVKLWLECGHETYRKGSQRPTDKARCHSCAQGVRDAYSIGQVGKLDPDGVPDGAPDGGAYGRTEPQLAAAPE